MLRHFSSGNYLDEIVHVCKKIGGFVPGQMRAITGYFGSAILLYSNNTIYILYVRAPITVKPIKKGRQHITLF